MFPYRETSAVLGAASFVVVTQVATRDSLDWSLSIAVILFAATLPFFVLFWLRPPVRGVKLEIQGDVEGIESFLAVVFLNISGFAGFFAHFGIAPAVVFVLATLVAVISLAVRLRFTLADLWKIIRHYPSLPTRLLAHMFQTTEKRDKQPPV